LGHEQADDSQCPPNEPGAKVACNPTPEPVSGLTGVTSIAGGFEHSLALLASGSGIAWGAHFLGQLGVGDKTRSHKSNEAQARPPGATIACSTTPVPVSRLSGPTAISAGGYFSLAVVSKAPPVPTVTNVEPNSGPRGGGTLVTITGTNFKEVISVKFGSAEA